MNCYAIEVCQPIGRQFKIFAFRTQKEMMEWARGYNNNLQKNLFLYSTIEEFNEALNATFPKRIA